MRSRLPAAGAIIVAAATFTSVFACAVAPHLNQAVEIADENAIVVWDSASQTEHFIRRASFKTEAADFGFLVPTPAKPELAEASDTAFTELARITAPKVETRPRATSSGCSLGCSAEKSAAMPPENAVRVLEEKRVAGYDAAVLEADDTGALFAWLKEHGYEFSDSLKSWADYYVKSRWKITAFKVARKSADQPSVSTSSVRMSFKTDKPFYPYREPVNQFPGYKPTLGSRLLRVFFISSERVEGTLENKLWPGRTIWANAITPENREKLMGQLKLPPKSGPDKWWLTEFEDHSSPRPGKDDVFFARSATQSPVERRPQIQYVSSDLPGCIMCMATCACAVGMQVLRRRRAT
jgi:hypothetical protein